MTVISAVVVTYNSDAGLEARLGSYATQVNYLIIVDNSNTISGKSNVDAAVSAIPNAQLHRNEANLGLAKAQNLGLSIALQYQSDWILLMDDDSIVSNNMVATMLQAAEQTAHFEHIGILAPRVIDKESGIEGRIIVQEGPLGIRRRICDPQSLGCDTTLTVIASGSLIRAQAIRDCGVFLEKYFIDSLDIEFSLRLKSKGWIIFVVRDATLLHSLGAKTQHRLCGLTFITSNHPVWRRYTMYRNRVDIWRNYAIRFPTYVVMDMMVGVFELIKITLFEPQKLKKWCAIIHGLADGLSGRFLPPAIR